MNIDALRARLDGTRGREYWRSLESLAETPEFKEFLHREFPQNASEWLDPVGRRNFLKLMGASLALAGVSACTRQPNEELVPYVRQPEELVPGKPLFFATAMPMNGAGIGLLVESHEGRPTKIEGNPDHPSSRGATDVFAQAAILGLYDPDRSQTLTNLGDIRPFASFAATGQGALVQPESRARRRRPDPHGNRRLSDAGGADHGASRASIRRPSGCSGSRPAGTTPARAAARPSANTSTRSTRSRRRRSSCRSMPTSSAPAPPASNTPARLRRAAGWKATARRRTACMPSRARRRIPARARITACRCAPPR